MSVTLEIDTDTHKIKGSNLKIIPLTEEMLKGTSMDYISKIIEEAIDQAEKEASEKGVKIFV